MAAFLIVTSDVQHR